MSTISITACSRLLMPVAIVAVVLGSTGCHHSYQGYRYNHSIDKYLARKRASLQAWYVWRQCADQCQCGRIKDYRRGFIDGYCDVALGGDGCAPVVPPNRYWGWRYQDAGGAECVAAWYEGHPVGVAAALEAGSHYEIQTIVPETSEYEEFRDEFYNRYDDSAKTLVPTAEPAPVLAPTTEDDPTYEAVLPEVDDSDFDAIDDAAQDLLEAPEAPAPNTAPALDVSGETAESIDEADLLESLEALERETLKRASR
ncbi:MAG: hypothetical protein AB8G99_10320 [Planctomycetaceae bacterium]